jgi:type IV pilus assembly protein PilA
MSASSGFTLIELMVVVAIVGILTAIALPQYQNYLARSQFAESGTLLRGAQLSIEDLVLRRGHGNTGLELGDDVPPFRLQGRHGAITTIDDAAARFTVTYTFGTEGTTVTPRLDGGSVSYAYADDRWTCESVSAAIRAYASGLCDTPDAP